MSSVSQGTKIILLHMTSQRLTLNNKQHGLLYLNRFYDWLDNLYIMKMKFSTSVWKGQFVLHYMWPTYYNSSLVAYVPCEVSNSITHRCICPLQMMHYGNLKQKDVLAEQQTEQQCESPSLPSVCYEGKVDHIITAVLAPDNGSFNNHTHTQIRWLI